MTTIHDDDLDQVLQHAYPQSHALLRHESGIELLCHGARSLIESPQLARDVLGAKPTRALGRALLALGQRYVVTAERLLELAEQPDRKRTGEKQHSGQSIQHTDVDSITSRARAKSGEADGRT